YTHARICSVLRKAAEQGIAFEDSKISCELLPEEIELIKMLNDYPTTVQSAGEAFAPSMIAAYTYELCKSFNGYYHDHSILREENEAVKKMRLQLAQQVARIIKRSMRLLGIDVPERM
ncbi:MAG: arginine--tRNA ligase, partial [Alistipes sp.]|nr:arginine--tRNA ligase [Alistipes sp.]